MNFDEKFVLAFAIILFITPAVTSTLSGTITATDWLYRHSEWIGQYLKGDFMPIFEYPPLFHWMMLLPVYFNVEIYFQVVFGLLAFFGILYAALKLEGEKAMLITAVLLAVSIAFVEFSSALMPQALDYFLFSLILLAYFKNRYVITTALSVIMFFTHNTGLIFIGILLVHSLLTKRYKFAKIFLAMLLLISPLFYYYQFVAVQNLKEVWNYEAQAQWEAAYMNPWWRFFALSGLLTWVMLPLALWKLYKKKFKLSDTQLLYIVWIAAFLSFLPFNEGIWRMISYQIVPLSLLVASLVSKNE
jgi:hypothetical protein